MRLDFHFSFTLEKSPGWDFFVNQRQYTTKEIIEPVLSVITFYLEHDDRESFEFNGEALTFASSQMMN